MIPILMHQMCISTIDVSSVMLRPKNAETGNGMTVKKKKTKTKTTKQRAVKWSQIRGMIDLQYTLSVM
jgi:hypothetical protein